MMLLSSEGSGQRHRPAAFAVTLLVSALALMPAVAEAADMSVYIGKAPTEAVNNGTSFLDDPRVIDLVGNALPDPALRTLVLVQTRERAYVTRIFESQDKIYFNAVDPTHGSNDSWGIAISPDGEDGAVCIAIGAGDLPEGEWYRGGRVVSISPDGCPVDAVGLARAFGG